MKRRDVIAGLLCAGAIPSAHPQQKMDKSTVDRWMKELSNWGRWGKTDQLGTVNHLAHYQKPAIGSFSPM